MTTHVIPPAVLALKASFPRTYMDAPTVQFSAPNGYFDLPTPMFLDTSQSYFLFSPVATYCILYNAPAGAEAYFYIDGDYVVSKTVDSGRKAGVMLTTGPLSKGTHWITAQVNGVTVREIITLARGPNMPLEPVLPDAPPQIVAGALVNGRYRWVLQDLAVQGIGSWVMPLNPVNMAPLPKVKALTTAPTVAVQNGRTHISEGHKAPQEWSFTGYCPDFAFYSKLMKYGSLNRRFYLIDHRNRAWNVTFTSVDIVPRKRQREDDGRFNDWAGDYTVKALIYSQTPKTPE